MGKYTLNLTRDSPNHVLLTYSIVFIINVLKKEEERVVSLFIVLKAYNVLNYSDNFKCLNNK